MLACAIVGNGIFGLGWAFPFKEDHWNLKAVIGPREIAIG
jgi:hypothetical protein